MHFDKYLISVTVSLMLKMKVEILLCAVVGNGINLKT